MVCESTARIVIPTREAAACDLLLLNSQPRTQKIQRELINPVGGHLGALYLLTNCLVRPGKIMLNDVNLTCDDGTVTSLNRTQTVFLVILTL